MTKIFGIQWGNVASFCEVLIFISGVWKYRKFFLSIVKYCTQKLKLLNAKIRKHWEKFVGIEVLKKQHEEKIEELIEKKDKEIELCWKNTSIWRDVSWFCSLKDDLSKGVLYTIIKDDDTEHYCHYIQIESYDRRTHFNLHMSTYYTNINELKQKFNGEEKEHKNSMKINTKIEYTFKDSSAIIALRQTVCTATKDLGDTNRIIQHAL